MALTDGIIAYWNFDQTTGNLLDQTDNNYDASPNNTPNQSATGIISTAWDFDEGSDETADVDIDFVTDNAGATVYDGTISIWFKADAGSDDARLIHYGASNISYGVGFYQSKIYIECYYFGNILNVQFDDVLTLDGSTWNHIIWTSDETDGQKFYLNGSATTAVTYNAGAQTTDACFFTCADASATNCVLAENNNKSGFWQYNGIMDEFGVWDRALSAAEAAEIWNSGAGLTYPFSSGPDYTKLQINQGDVWKAGAGVQLNYGDIWKTVSGMQINEGDTWKEIF